MDVLIEEKIAQAVSLKRDSDFNGANLIYEQLNDQYPHSPVILKSWAKTLVCLGLYEDAINKFQLAVKLFIPQGMENHAWQCNNQIMEIRNRSKTPEQFKKYIRAVSGGTILDPKM
ncbi:MAG: hypothetical protein HOD37_01970 [Bacteroidetes bacterium]|jgi:hypothetical protein|nr:hypothetical protein [Bacteroidota bacterium]